jgi:CBS domain-containing protein
MRVDDLMTRALITVTPSTPVLEARALMTQRHVRHLLVVENGLLAGIITDRDIRLNLPSPATSLSVWEMNYLLAQLTVDKVMTRSVITVDSGHDAREVARIMVDRRIGALPVMDGRRPIGIVTETDMLRAFVMLADGQPPASGTPA